MAKLPLVEVTCPACYMHRGAVGANMSSSKATPTAYSFPMGDMTVLSVYNTLRQIFSLSLKYLNPCQKSFSLISLNLSSKTFVQCKCISYSKNSTKCNNVTVSNECFNTFIIERPQEHNPMKIQVKSWKLCPTKIDT